MGKKLTLQEGLDAFNKKNAKYFSDRDTSEEAKEFFRCHDIAHVVFGCDTSIYGEGVVKIWTVFGTSLGFWKHITGYQEADAFALFGMYSWGHVAKNLLGLFISIPSIIIRAKRMSKLWHWSDFERYMDTPIDKIREEFNIDAIKG